MDDALSLFPDDCLGSDYTVRTFRSLAALKNWSAENSWIHVPARAQQIAEHALAQGITGAWVGRVPPSEVHCTDSNYRESLLADGLNPRQRAVLDLLTTLPAAVDADNVTIYATEGVTNFAKRLRARFRRFMGSEYAPTVAEQKRIRPVEHQDLAKLSYQDDAFDIVISNEVFEHLPDLPASLRELVRVTRPGGTLIATFPFLPFAATSIVKARLRPDGSIDYLMEREIHGNPMDPSGGSLVFQVPAWDIVDMARAAGFGQAEIVLISSLRAGITSADGPPIFVLAARP